MTAKQKIQIINVIVAPESPSVYVQFLDSSKELNHETAVYCCEKLSTFFDRYDYLSTDINMLNEFNHAVENAIARRSKLLDVRAANEGIEADIEDWKGVVTTEIYSPSSTVTGLFQTLGKEDQTRITQAVRDNLKETQK